MFKPRYFRGQWFKSEDEGFSYDEILKIFPKPEWLKKKNLVKRNVIFKISFLILSLSYVVVD